MDDMKAIAANWLQEADAYKGKEDALRNARATEEASRVRLRDLERQLLARVGAKVPVRVFRFNSRVVVVRNEHGVGVFEPE
jgi:hypothetical protein